MKISIITVCRNSKATIQATLKSILYQCYENIEHIVIDGNSSDGTIELVKINCQRISKFVSNPDHGIYDAMNKGLALATGEYVAYLNSDDFYASRTAIQQVAIALNQMKADVIYGDLSYVKRNDPNKRVRYWKSQPFQPGSFSRGFSPPHPAFFIKRKLLEKLGGFDLSYNLASDFDLMFRALEIHKYKSTYLPVELTCMRTGGATNKSIKNVVRQNKEILKCFHVHGVSISSFSFIARKLLIRARQIFSKHPQALIWMPDIQP